MSHGVTEPTISKTLQINNPASMTVTLAVGWPPFIAVPNDPGWGRWGA